MKQKTQTTSLEVRRRRPRAPGVHEGHTVQRVLHLRLVKKEGAQARELGSLPPVPLVQAPDGTQEQALPLDRARTWHELLRWVEHLYIFADPQIQERQYQNRFKWENSAGQRPAPQELYDWKQDESALQRLRPAWRALGDTLAAAIGRPQGPDFAALYPNLYDDVGLSDDARRVIRELNAVFGSDFVLR